MDYGLFRISTYVFENICINFNYLANSFKQFLGLIVLELISYDPCFNFRALARFCKIVSSFNK